MFFYYFFFYIMIAIIILVVAVIGVVWRYSTYNSIIKNKNAVENNKSTIQTVMQNRYDLIPNLVEVVKQYTKHEKGTLEGVIKMRSQLTTHDNVDASAAQEENMLSSTLKSIFALSESYPELKADKQFTQLQNQLTELEDRMQAARRGYNYAVTSLRNKREMFPSSIVANSVALEDYELFEADTDAGARPDVSDMFNG